MFFLYIERIRFNYKSRHMSIKKFLITSIVIFSCLNCHAQFDDHAQITSHIKSMFESMRTGNSSRMPDLFEEDATLESVFFNKQGETVSSQSNIADFIKAVGEPHDEIWDERIHSYDINIDGPLAIAWTPYSFYVGQKFSHCGVNVFTFIKQNDEWKIKQILDTRKRKDCTE